MAGGWRDILGVGQGQDTGVETRVAPDSRTFYVPAEDRVFVVEAEDRVFVVEAEDRVFVVEAV